MNWKIGKERGRVEVVRKVRTARKVSGRKGLFVALGVFLSTAALAVIVNSFVFQKGFHLGWSVSRYVGSETWSAVVFTMGNLIVVRAVMWYLWRLGAAWKLPRVYYYCAFLMAVGLILLSVFPVGYFDIEGKKSVISLMHELSSRTMFIMMMLMAAMLAGRRQATARARGCAVAFVVYAVFCVTGHLSGAEWFVPLTLIYESVYIAAFPLMLASCRVRE